MCRNMNVEEIKASGIGDLVEPMVWSYYVIWQKHLATVDHLYPSAFSRIWGATSFKGSTGETAILPNVHTHMLVHTTWLEALRNSKHKYKHFQGMVLTGWQRYTHFSPLCELLPVGIPSLTVDLNIMRYSTFDSVKTLTNVSKQLGCIVLKNKAVHLSLINNLNALSNDPLLNTLTKCKFPGGQLNDAVRTFYNWQKLFMSLHAFFAGKDGTVTPFSKEIGYETCTKLMDKKSEWDRLKARHANIRRELNDSLTKVFDKYTTNEILETYMGNPLAHKMEEIKAVYDVGCGRTTWLRRPTYFDFSYNTSL